MENNFTSISYLVTCHNEEETLRELLERIKKYMTSEDECIILDDYSDNPETIKILEQCRGDRVYVFNHRLDKNYSEHKNTGKGLCKSTYICQFDADELPSEMLLLNIKSIITANPEVELFWIPRINDFDGNYQSLSNRWGWKLTSCLSIIREKEIDTESEEYKFLKNNGYIIEESKI